MRNYKRLSYTLWDCISCCICTKEKTEIDIGVGLEAVLLILDYAFNRLGLNKLTAIVYGDNILSQQDNTIAVGLTQESYLREQAIDPDSEKFLDLYGNGMTL